MQDELGQKILLIMDKLNILEQQVKELKKIFREASEERIKHTLVNDGEVMFRYKNIDGNQVLHSIEKREPEN